MTKVIDQDFEEDFVNSYVCKNKKTRVLYELKHSQKRSNCILRFCHNSIEYLDYRLVEKCDRINQIMHLDVVMNNCLFYVVSLKYIMGIYMNYKELIEYLDSEYMSVIIMTKQFAIIKEESEGKSLAYLLKKN